MKKCSKCGIEKNLSNFHKNKNNKDGLHGYCVDCNRVATAKSVRLKRTGCSFEVYNKLFKYQKGCCAICGEHQNNLNRALAADHCHSTGIIRGLLCMKCNTAIGKLNDDVSLVLKAAAYLTNPPYEDKDE